MSLEKDIAIMVMLKKVKEMNMVNVVQNQDSFYQTLDTELENWQQKLQQHIGTHYVPNFTSSIPATDYVYAYLDKNQELVISSVDLHPNDSELYDEECNFGKCELVNDGDQGQKWWCKKTQILTVRFANGVKPITCYEWFNTHTNLTEIKNMENLDTSECTDMYAIFYNCYSLTTLDVSNFDTSNVTDMYHMFYSCTSLTTLDVSNFDTNNVTSMYCMFENCTSLTTLDVSNFNTSKVVDMSYMFYNCTSLTTLDISNFDTKNVTDMSCMFYRCESLSTLDLSNFDTSNVTNMDYMFEYCTSLTTITCPESVNDKILSEGKTTIPSRVTWTII